MFALTRSLRWLLLAVLLPCLTACIQVEVRFDVRPDGSGQVTETYRVREDAAWLPKLASPLSAYLHPAYLAERASALGPGVSSSVEVLPKEGGHHVAQATFNVPDVHGMTWRFGQQPTSRSLSYRFEMTRRAGQPARLDVINDPFAVRLRSLDGGGSRAWLVDAIEGMSGIAVDVRVRAEGQALHSTGRWQEGAETTLFAVQSDTFMARPGWQDRVRDTRPGAFSPCTDRSDASMRIDCQDRISIWLR